DLTAVSGCQMTCDERDAALAPEGMLVGEDFLFEAVGGSEYRIDLTHLSEAFKTRLNGEDVVALARFDKQRPGRDQPRDVVHLGPIEDAGNVIVDAMRETADAVAEGVQIAAHISHFQAGLDGGRKQTRGASPRDADDAHARPIQIRARLDVVDRPHD